MVVEKLGVDAIELIKHNPDVLNEIAITPKQRSIIYSGILSDKNNQEAVRVGVFTSGGLIILISLIIARLAYSSSCSSP